jgi:RNA polymerase sigma-70 factor (ECF subfamily)
MLFPIHHNRPSICIWPRETPKLRDAPALDLVPRLQARDETAFREVVDQYMSRIYRAAFGIVRNRDAADEIAKEVFVKVYFSTSAFPGRTSLYPWIYRIAVNECYAYLLSQRRQLEYRRDWAIAATMPIETVADVRHGSDRPGMRRDLINMLLANIPEDDRWLLIGKEVEGFSLSELAQISGLSVQTIKGRLFKIREHLIAAAGTEYFLRSRNKPSI